DPGGASTALRRRQGQGRAQGRRGRDSGQARSGLDPPLRDRLSERSGRVAPAAPPSGEPAPYSFTSRALYAQRSESPLVATFKDAWFVPGPTSEVLGDTVRSSHAAPPAPRNG